MEPELKMSLSLSTTTRTLLARRGIFLHHNNVTKLPDQYRSRLYAESSELTFPGSEETANFPNETESGLHNDLDNIKTIDESFDQDETGWLLLHKPLMYHLKLQSANSD